MAVERAKRKTRTPVTDSIRSRLRVDGKDPEFEYYIVNDTDGRIDLLKEAGWETVTDNGVKIGDRRVSNPTDTGSAKTVSVGGGVTGVLMKIPKEWWEEDQARKQQNATATVKQTIADAKAGGDYGDIKIS